MTSHRLLHRVAPMRRLVVLPAAATLAVGMATAHAAAPGFQYGVAAGQITATSALIWTRAPAPGRVRFAVFPATSSVGVAKFRSALAPKAGDQTATVGVYGLRPGTRYRYIFEQRGARSQVGTFETAPAKLAAATVRFAISGDADATPGANGKPGFNRFEVYGRMAAEGNDFNINLGDTIYSDSRDRRIAGRADGRREVGQVQARPRAAGAAQAPSLDRPVQPLGRPRVRQRLLAAPRTGRRSTTPGVEAFLDYAPVDRGVPRPRPVQELPLGEEPASSSSSTSARSARRRRPRCCNGDLAPTAPEAVRDAFATLAPGLKNPVAPLCTSTLDDPARTMLGATQYAAFTKAIKASTATWKVIVNEVPIQQYYALPYDRWEGYEAERERLLHFLQENVKNVVFLTTDTHANLVNEVRYSTLGGPPAELGIWEVVTGPVATNTFAKEIDGYLGQKGAGTAIGALFFKPPPPNGMGMRCAALDTYSYAEVTATARALTVELKDAKGQPVREATGTACSPLVLAAR